MRCKYCRVHGKGERQKVARCLRQPGELSQDTETDGTKILQQKEAKRSPLDLQKLSLLAFQNSELIVSKADSE